MSERIALEHEVIALAARGLMALADADLPDAAFTGAPRLFAWVCALVSLRLHGRRNTFYAVRLHRVCAPRPDLPLDEWRDLNHATDAELDAAERLDELDPAAPRRLRRIAETTTDERTNDQ